MSLRSAPPFGPEGLDVLIVGSRNSFDNANLRFASLCLCLTTPFPSGAVYENHRKKWLPGFTVGPLHNTKWRYITNFLLVLLCY